MQDLVQPSDYKPGLSKAEVSRLAGGKPITKLSSNENPFGPSPKALVAIRDILDDAHVYPPRNDAALREALATFHGRGLTSANFVAANGGLEVLSLVEDALIAPGQRAIICPPCFGAYASSLTMKGAVVDRIPLKGLEFEVDVEAILAAVTSDTRLLYLCNPNNPTGTWFDGDVLSGLLDRLPETVTLIYDEVYYQFATESGLPDAVQHVLDGRNIVIIHSFSKAYGLAGMRLGYGLAAPHVIAQIERRKRSFHIAASGLAAAAAALTDTDHIALTVDNNHVERRRLTAGLHDLGLQTTPSQANFLMFRCPEPEDAKALTAKLIGEGVMVRPAFDLPHHIRVTVGRPEDNDRLLAVLAELIGSH